MTILTLLIQDHVQLRKALIKIRQDLLSSNIRSDIRVFISLYELHESIEDEILVPTLKKILEEKHHAPLAEEYEKMHHKVWNYLDQLTQSLLEPRFSDLQNTFFAFVAFVESHFGYEERILFPLIDEIVDKKELVHLGERASERMKRFYATTL